MTLSIGQPIRDLATGEARFKLLSLLARGDRYDIALAEDTHLDNKQVCVKAIRYDDPSDPAEVTARRADLDAELQALTLPSHLLPEPLDWLQIENARDFPPSHPSRATEPLLVYELQTGKTLRDALSASPDGAHEGIDPARALTIARELALLLQHLHAQGHLFRDLSPQHVILGLDDILHVVGCGNIARARALPSATRRVCDRPFVAPELRDPQDAALFAPPADIFSLGALLCWLLTGREPLKIPECPLDALAFHRLGQLDPGLGQLVARMIAANPARRFPSVDALLPHLNPAALPNPAHPDFRDVTLPSPFRLDEAPKTFQPLPTAGPLIVRDVPDAPAPAMPAPAPPAAPTPAPAVEPAPPAAPAPIPAADALPAPTPAAPPAADALPAPIPAARRTDLAVRGIIGGTFLLIFAIIFTALKLKGYF